jgi:hypothetical protein
LGGKVGWEERVRWDWNGWVALHSEGSVFYVHIGCIVLLASGIDIDIGIIA